MYSVVLVRVINAVSFGMILYLFYPATKANPIYGILGLVCAVLIVKLASIVDTAEGSRRNLYLWLQVSVMIGLIILAVVVGYSPFYVFGGSAIWAIVGLIDGGVRVWRKSLRQPT
jgi:hypothetical protein